MFLISQRIMMKDEIKINLPCKMRILLSTAILNFTSYCFRIQLNFVAQSSIGKSLPLFGQSLALLITMPAQ